MAFGKDKSGIPSGMSSMLKMFGVDPAEIMKSVDTLRGGVTQIAESLKRIEEQNACINKKLDQLLERGTMTPEVAKIIHRAEERNGRGSHAATARD